jgi:formylglycine-generating enzyme required for sulfatase activity
MAARRIRCLLLLALTPASACIEGKTRASDGSLDGAGDTGTDDVYVPPVGTWITVEPGSFLMGPRKDNPCADESSRRKVTLTRRYQISAKEATRRQFEQVMGYTPDTLKRDPACPAVVRWYEAAAYCNALSKKAGLPACYRCSGAVDTLTCALDPGVKKSIYGCPGYRLPTEAEWERAYRAGTQTDLYNGNLIETECRNLDPAANLIAWYCDEIGYTSVHPVGQKEPNSWGLYDMAGNAWEWCADGYEGDLGSTGAVDPWTPGPVGKYFAQRGGSYMSRGCYVRAVARREGGLSFSYGSAFAAIRCVRSLK